MNEDKGARVANQTEWRIQTDGRTTNKRHNNKTAQQSEIPLTLAQKVLSRRQVGVRRIAEGRRRREYDDDDDGETALPW